MEWVAPKLSTKTTHWPFIFFIFCQLDGINVYAKIPSVGCYSRKSSKEVNSLADVHGLTWTGLWMDTQDTDGEDAVAELEKKFSD